MIRSGAGILAATTRGRSEIVLGREVLNRLKIILDGPAATIEIARVSV
jgi:hypothetical protein